MVGAEAGAVVEAKAVVAPIYENRKCKPPIGNKDASVLRRKNEPFRRRLGSLEWFQCKGPVVDE